MQSVRCGLCSEAPYTSSMTAISAASPRRVPMRVMPGVAAVAVGILRGDFIEHLLGNILAGDEGQRLTVGSHVLLLAKGDHFLGQRRDLFCAEDGRLHAAHIEQIRDLLTEHRLALIGGLTEFPCSGHIGFPP